MSNKETTIDDSLRLQALIAMLRAVTATAEMDIAKYGEWQGDYHKPLYWYSEQIESILGISMGEGGGE